MRDRDHCYSEQFSDCNPLDLIECNCVASAVVKLGGARRFVVGDGLGVLDRAAVFQVGGDTGCPPRVATYLNGQAGGMAMRNSVFNGSQTIRR